MFLYDSHHTNLSLFNHICFSYTLSKFNPIGNISAYSFSENSTFRLDQSENLPSPNNFIFRNFVLYLFFHMFNIFCFSYTLLKFNRIGKFYSYSFFKTSIFRLDQNENLSSPDNFIF